MFAVRRSAVPLLMAAMWLVAIPAVHAGLPWWLSTWTTRWGWSGGKPGVWNLIGLGPIGFGIGLLLFVMVIGFRSIPDLPEKIPLGWKPVGLLTNGPYRFSRNPMYMGEAALWLGWTILYGSPTVLGASAIFLVGVNIVVSGEERTLSRLFGDLYRDYSSRVPRWL